MAVVAVAAVAAAVDEQLADWLESVDWAFDSEEQVSEPVPVLETETETAIAIAIARADVGGASTLAETASVDVQERTKEQVDQCP